MICCNGKCNHGRACVARPGAVSHWMPDPNPDTAARPGTDFADTLPAELARAPAHGGGNFWLPDPVDQVEHLTFTEVALVFFCLLVCIASIVAVVGTFAGFSWARWLA